MGSTTEKSRGRPDSNSGVQAGWRRGLRSALWVRLFVVLSVLAYGTWGGVVRGEVDPEPDPVPEEASLSPAEILYQTAVESGNRRDFPKARAQLEETLRLQPDHLQADLALGVVLMVLGEQEEGRARLERIGTLPGPMATQAHSLLANQASLEGRHEDVVKHYVQGIEQSPDEVAMRVNLGRSLFSQGRFEEAIPVFEAALILKPDAKAAWVDLGRSFVRLGRTADGEVCFRNAIELEKGNISANWYLARIEADRGEKEKANALYDVAARSAKRLRKKDMLLRILMEQNSL